MKKDRSRIERYFEGTSLQLRQEEHKGRYVVCRRPIRAGECVLEVPAYTISLHPSYRKRFCINCCTHASSPLNLSCPGCKKVWYCSKECMARENSPTKSTLLHNQGDRSCELMKKLASLWKEDKETELFVTNICLLLCRRLLEEEFKRLVTEKEEEESGTQTATNSMASFEDIRHLISHFPSLDLETIERYQEITKHILHLFPDQRWDPTWLAKLISKEESNSFGLFDPKGKCYGRGTFTVAAYFNHSCFPNLARMLDKNTFKFYAVVDIPQGEELAISYIDLNVPYSTRQAKLRTSYHFDCGCSRCCETDESVENRVYALLCKISGCGGLLVKWDIEIVGEDGEIKIKEGKKCVRCAQTFLEGEGDLSKKDVVRVSNKKKQQHKQHQKTRTKRAGK